MKNKIMITLLLAASMTLGCSTNEILLEPNVSKGFSIINGDSIINRVDNIKKSDFYGHPDSQKYFTTGDTIINYKKIAILKSNKITNLINISNSERKGKKFRLVVFGSSLGAGVRDGGLFNEGMETCYGNLVANQLGIEFKLPLFNLNDYNGFGRIERSGFNPSGGPMIKYKDIVNNTAIDLNLKTSSGKVVLKKFIGDYDNFSTPYEPFIIQEKRRKNLPNEQNSFIERTGGVNTLQDLKDGKNYDFFLMDLPHNSIYDAFQGTPGEYKWEEFGNKLPYDHFNLPNDYSSMGSGSIDFYNHFFNKLKYYKIKGILFNMPSKFDLPYNKQNFKNDLITILNRFQINELKTGVYNDGNPYFTTIEQLSRQDFIQGFSALDSLLAPNVNVKIKPGINNKLNYVSLLYSTNIERQNYETELNVINRNLDLYCKNLDFGLVDLHKLYKNIGTGTFMTNDGVKVDASWPKGNFFSSDGINPSAFGQAVIANEVIKILNLKFKMDVALINTRDFLK
jgi:hypothetical protein